MNAVLMLMYNTAPAQLELTKLTYESILAQDIGPLHIWLVNNGSNVETKNWLNSLEGDASHKLSVDHYAENIPPVKMVNKFAATIFALGYGSILGVPNDVILPKNMFAELEKWPRGFVAAWMNEDRDKVAPCEHAVAVHEDPHTSVLLTRRWAHDALVAKDGYFLDDNFTFYASDCDLKLRMAACGIHGVQLDIQAYHFSGASHRLAKPGIAEGIYAQADRDRAYFQRKYQFSVGSQEHVDAPKDINFKAESKFWS